MCSTPKPRTRVKGRSIVSGSILSNLSSESRSQFSERANTAQKRRQQIAMAEQQKNRQLISYQTVVQKTAIPQKKSTSNSFAYWLLSASIKEIIFALLFGRRRKH